MHIRQLNDHELMIEALTISELLRGINLSLNEGWKVKKPFQKGMMTVQMYPDVEAKAELYTQYMIKKDEA